MKKIIPIFYACDDCFVKYTIVSLKSIIMNASKNYKYNIHILSTTISENMKIELKKLESEIFSIQFNDVNDYLKVISEKLPIRDYYSKTTYFRLFIADMFPQYKKVIYIDSDTVVLKDISKLYNQNLKDNYVGACVEQVMVQTDVYGTYVEKVVGIDRKKFFNAGLLLINCVEFRKNNLLSKFKELLQTYTFKVTQDEDYLNVLCKDRVYYLNPAWNVEVYGNIPVKEKDIAMIHYIMVSKPWHYTDCRLKKYFFEYAKQTTVFDLIMEELNNYSDKQKENDLLSCERLAKLAIEETNKDETYLTIINKRKSQERLEVLKKIQELESQNVFDVDVENDPETIPLKPNTVDFTKKKKLSKFKGYISLKAAHFFYRRLVKKNQIIIDDIRGLENFQNLSSGAIITCNHFNALDSFAIHIAYDKAKQKGRKFFRVIREGNYTSFPGFYGFLMRNCYTLPLSSGKETMQEFIKSTNELLQQGHFILFYPEQSMWWNYRKPKPLKDGAYHFAVKNNVPVLPCFITMEDSKYIDADGFNVQKYTIHIAKPIYPLKDKTLKENVKYMKDENYQIWKEIYESFYGKKLIYETKRTMSES